MRGGTGEVFPAAVLLVAQNGEVAFQRAYGWLDPETARQPTRVESLFDLASLTKIFVVTAFMTLVEAGRVHLDTPVAQIVPEFGGIRPIVPSEDPLTREWLPPEPAFAGKTVNANDVTFWHLLTHTSGLAAWRGLFLKDETNGEIPLPHQLPERTCRERRASIWNGYGFAYFPGQRLVYSDLGLILLGEAISRLAGMPLEAYLAQSVWLPLGLENTGYNPLARGIAPKTIAPTEFCSWRRRRCWGEVHDENAAFLGGISGHAGLFSTAADVAMLGQMYLGLGKARLLSAETIGEMTRAQVSRNGTRRGLGWLLPGEDGSSPVGTRLPRTSYGHTGFTGTSLWIIPERELVIVLLTNRVYYGRDGTGIADFRQRLHNAVITAAETQ
jgi:CubicO group peptidase (beta-lactamase class C family)